DAQQPKPRPLPKTNQDQPRIGGSRLSNNRVDWVPAAVSAHQFRFEFLSAGMNEPERWAFRACEMVVSPLPKD
ncbi:hypothetical protein AB6813_09380, partial [bacterium RCC_150]